MASSFTEALIPATMCLLLVLRAAIGLAGYSGEGQPPMHGDYEAQRHWMEVTMNLPPTQWYVAGTDNDLLYWGLDYPPLSAHTSLLVGMVAQRLHPELIALHSSQGLETKPTRAFMRNSVLVLDALTHLPAAFACAKAGAPPGAARLLLLLQLAALPALVLVDHGHFQYNCVSLGLTLWGLLWAMSGRPLACAAAFSLALNFKQMSLYLAPAFFCYLLSGCLRRRRTVAGKVLAVAQLGCVVLATFGACWAPFLTRSADALAVIRRVFPVERHLYEDKVANLWCTLALLPPLKLKATLSISTLLRLALGTTLGALLPPCALLLARPSRLGFLLCATACGLAFFLCSFQVHEKHILLPLLPASLLSARQPTLFAWFAASAAFSLYPLLKRDGQALPYAVCQLGFLWLSLALNASAASSLPRLVRAAMAASLLGMVVLHALEACVPPPARYPDLHTVAFAAYSCIHFVLAYVVVLVWQCRAVPTEEAHTPFDAPPHATPFIFASRGKRE